MSDKTRINRVTTRSGDSGETGLANGARVVKDHPRIHAMGDIDELNACLGMLAAKSDDLAALMAELQQVLFDIGAEMAIPDSESLSDTQVSALESRTEALNAALPPLREFVLPGGNETAAWCHVCRTVARRAERSLVSLDQVEAVNPATLRWINRLSDLLFVLARTINRDGGKAEPQWRRDAPGNE
ncbi:MAG: cob(I)yrinic acid a,c-diamide adenosyltransferase [Alcanivoracaceae bacterium]|nr:cob(I)yrinic acid a,c-diamide adenosyltransferase [Alcanivoracaceae bacterium]